MIESGALLYKELNVMTMSLDQPPVINGETVDDVKTQLDILGDWQRVNLDIETQYQLHHFGTMSTGFLEHSLVIENQVQQTFQQDLVI